MRGDLSVILSSQIDGRSVSLLEPLNERARAATSQKETVNGAGNGSTKSLGPIEEAHEPPLIIDHIQLEFMKPDLFSQGGL
jgi:hypothetical protein